MRQYKKTKITKPNKKLKTEEFNYELSKRKEGREERMEKKKETIIPSLERSVFHYYISRTKDLND